jgi:hypothetical protein
MDLRAAIGKTTVQMSPLDPGELSVPQKALLLEWVNDWHRRQGEADKAARAEAERNRKG